MEKTMEDKEEQCNACSKESEMHKNHGRIMMHKNHDRVEARRNNFYFYQNQFHKKKVG